MVDLKRMAKEHASTIAAFLILAIILQLGAVILTTNPMVDEQSGITIGYYSITHLDTTLQIFNPPLAYELSALPLLFLDLNAPLSFDECKNTFVFYGCAQKFFFEQGNNPEQMALFAKIPFIILSILLALLLYLFAKGLYGQKAALFALFLYAFSTSMLGFGSIVFTDLAVTLFIFSTVYFLWRILTKGYSTWRIVAVGISLGLALASKFTALLLFPLILIFFVMAHFMASKKMPWKAAIKTQAKRYFLISLIAFLVMFSTYFFSFTTAEKKLPERYIAQIDDQIDAIFGEQSVMRGPAHFLVHRLPMPMPEYFFGILSQFRISVDKEGYLNGQSYTGGKWYYFLEVLALKIQIPLLIFFLASLLYTAWQIPKDKDHKKRAALLSDSFVLIPFFSFLVFFMFMGLNLGLRHALPLLPFMMLLGSKIVPISQESAHKELKSFILAVLMGWYVLSALLIAPHYAAYFNEIVGPDNGHQYLLSSNLDLGQDLKGLVNYLQDNNITNVKLSYHVIYI